MMKKFAGGAFIENLPKIYGMYTGGFLVFVLLMAILEQMGVGADTIGILFVAFTIVIYAGIGVLSRTMAVDAYYVAGRQVPAVFNGMATAADWMSGASFVAMARSQLSGLSASCRSRFTLCFSVCSKRRHSSTTLLPATVPRNATKSSGLLKRVTASRCRKNDAHTA